MLASISSISKNNESTITVQLQDGRKIVGRVDSQDKINILENTTNLDTKIAECAAGIALVNVLDLDNDVMVWRRLVDMAHKCKAKMELMKYSVN